MAVNPDLSKPLSEEEIEDLRGRLPESLVEHYIALAQGSDFKDGETKDGGDPPTRGRRAKAADEPSDADSAGDDK